jgi:hypothetical protein
MDYLTWRLIAIIITIPSMVIAVIVLMLFGQILFDISQTGKGLVYA